MHYYHGDVIMADEMLRQIPKKSWYKWSIYVNAAIFIIIALFTYLLIFDCIEMGRYSSGDLWMYVVRDIAFIAIAYTLIFFQFFRNLSMIIRRSL